MQPFPIGRLFGVPVFASGTALFVLAYMVWSHGTETTGQIAQGILYGATIFFSILVHEMGHALVGRRLGLQPRSVLLHGFGGLCSYGRSPRPREGVFASAAGPVAGLGLGVISLVLYLAVAALPESAALFLVGNLLYQMVWINFFWSLFNLLPMWPLDGGHVLWYGLQLMLPGGRAWNITKGVGLVTAIATAAGAYALRDYFGSYQFVIIVAGLSVLQLLQRE